MRLWRQEWGMGTPVVALHPLALESTVFAGLGGMLARHGMRTIAVDLPGFGRSPAPSSSLTPGVMADAILRLVRRLEEPPVALGLSMGGRVALEAALIDPAAFRGVVLVAPYLPWRNGRWLLPLARLMDPRLVERIPLERFWPTLRKITASLEARPDFEHDWMMRASARVAYYLSCPATRAHFVAAARDLALDPAFGPAGTWTRLEALELPAAFVWGDRDRLIPREHADLVAGLLPRAHHVRVPCAGHFVNGEHHHCFEQAMASAVRRVLAAPRRRSAPSAVFTLAKCFADETRPAEAGSARSARR